MDIDSGLLRIIENTNKALEDLHKEIARFHEFLKVNNLEKSYRKYKEEINGIRALPE